MIKFLFIAVLFAACGAPEEEIVYVDKKPDNVKAYAWSDMKSYCLTCHNSSAPAIPLDEAGFKASAKVKKRIADGSMPPNNKEFKKDRALKYLEGGKDESSNSGDSTYFN